MNDATFIYELGRLGVIAAKGGMTYEQAAEQAGVDYEEFKAAGAELFEVPLKEVEGELARYFAPGQGKTWMVKKIAFPELREPGAETGLEDLLGTEPMGGIPVVIVSSEDPREIGFAGQPYGLEYYLIAAPTAEEAVERSNDRRRTYPLFKLYGNQVYSESGVEEMDALIGSLFTRDLVTDLIDPFQMFYAQGIIL